MSRLALVTVRLPHAGLDRLEHAREALSALDERSDVFGLATCQRVLACTLDERPRQTLSELADLLDVAGGERFVGMDAFSHLARVAASLDALVPGEDQVPAQFRQRLADQQASLDAELLDELQRVRSVARQARDAGDLTGHQGRSIVDRARRLVPDEGALAVLGTGTIAEEAVAKLSDERAVHVVSRSLERAQALAEPDRAWTRQRFRADPPTLAGAVACTGAGDAWVLDEHDGRRLAQARARPDELRLVDLAVPRAVDPALRGVAGIELSTVEDVAALASSTPEDDRIARARRELADRLALERRRRRCREVDERVVALREHLAEELSHLADKGSLATDGSLEKAQGRLAHAAQRHLEAALLGEAPP